MPFVSSTLKSFEKWRSLLFGATGNFNHQTLPYGILYLTFIAQMFLIYCHLNFHANLLRLWPFPLSNEFRISQVISRRNEKQIRIGRLCLVLVGRSCTICITKALRILF